MSCHEEYLMVALDQLLKPGHSARTGEAALCSPLWIRRVQLNDGLVEVSLQVVEEKKFLNFYFMKIDCMNFCTIFV